MTDDEPGPADSDDLFASHPDLVSPEWARKAERIARKEASRYRKASRPPRSPRSDRSERVPRRTVLNPSGRTGRILVAVVVLGSVLLAWHPWSRPSSSPPNMAITPPKVTLTSRRAASVDLAQPFANTPAAGWADDAAGIVVPAQAQPVGQFSAAEVGAAMAQVKQALVAAHLSDQVLVQHDTSGYLQLFAPNARGPAKRNFTPAKPDGGGELTLFAPGFHLLPAPVKVNGTMSASVGVGNRLVVHANYVFAYPFAPSDPSTISEYWQFIAVVHMTEDFEYADGAQYAPGDRGLWLTRSQGYTTNMACGEANKGYLAPAYSEPRMDGVNTGNPDSYFDPNHSLAITNTCH